jgi:peptidylamidoglycolate lyase
MDRLARSFWIALVLAPFGAAPGWAADAGPAPLPGTCAVDPAWPQKPAAFVWGAMGGVTVDPEDRVYLCTRGKPAVQVFKTDGTLVRAWEGVTFKKGHHIRLDPEGNVWVADSEGGHAVFKFTPEGRKLLTLGEPGKAGCDGSHFNGPTDMAILPGGDVFVADGYGNQRVAHFNKDGAFVKQWGSRGANPGQFVLPHGIAADSKGRLYVADRNASRVHVFDAAGKLLDVWDKVIVPWGIAITPRDEIWICGSSGPLGFSAPPKDQVVMQFTPEGKVAARYEIPRAASGSGKPGEVNWAHGIGVDSQGNFYIGDIQGRRAQKFVVKKP